MIWWQLLVTTVAPIVTTIITSLFMLRNTNKQIEENRNNKESDYKKNLEKKKAEDLYLTISPFVSNRSFLEYFDPPSYLKGLERENIEVFLYNRYIIDCETRDYKFKEFLKGFGQLRPYLLPNNQESEDFNTLQNLIFQGLISQEKLNNFILKYGTQPNKEQLNNDIKFINETLGKNIPEIK